MAKLPWLCSVTAPLPSRTVCVKRPASVRVSV
jgi:hypothetical protein